jgi:hypothetical protein
MENENDTPAEEIALSVQDIAYCKQIIETASTRGAFRADELQVVGLTYDKISSWLASVTETTKPDDEDVAEQGETND